MNYNDGAVKDVTIIEDKKKAAHDFSEGNIYLEELLNNCFENNILTIACCAGHTNTKNNSLSTPYISFYLTKENENVINNILILLLDSGYVIELTGSEKYPALTLRCPVDKNYNQFFIDINNVVNLSRTNKKNRSDLNEVIKKIYNIVLSNKSYYDFRVQKFNDKITLLSSFNNFYEVVSLDNENLLNYINNLIYNYNILYQDDVMLESYDRESYQKKEWIKFQQFLKDNNIELKEKEEFDILTKYGGYTSEHKIQCEIVVKENDTIFTVAEKLYKLRFMESVYAKAVINGIEINNTDFKQIKENNGRPLYSSDFSIDKCVYKYETNILNKLNKEKFNNELVILESSPLAIISFNNDNLSDEELSLRINELIKNKLDVIIKYKNFEIGLGILNNNNELSIDNFNNSIMLSMSGTTSVDLVFRLVDLYQHINTNDISDEELNQLFSYYKKSIVNDNLLELNRRGLINYLNKISPVNYMTLNDNCTINRVIPLIKFFKKYYKDENPYIDLITEKLSLYSLGDIEYFKIISNYFSYFDNNYQEESDDIKTM